MLIATCLLAATAIAQEDPAGKPRTDNAPLAAQVKSAIDQGKPAEALARAQELFASDNRDKLWLENARRIPGLLVGNGRKDEALTFLRSVKTGEYANGLKWSLAAEARDLAEEELDPARKLALLKEGSELFPHNGGYFSGYLRQLVRDGQIDTALAEVTQRGQGEHGTAAWMHKTRLGILRSAKRTEAARAEARQLLLATDNPADAMDALELLLPPDDVTLAAARTAQQLLDGIKLDLRGKAGKINAEHLSRIARQLTEGGEDRPLRLSDQAGQLAQAVAASQAPLKVYLAALLGGDYPAAFAEAYAQAKSARDDRLYVAWIKAAAGAVRCNDQHYNGRALGFLRFINGDQAENPLAQWVSQ
jgi:hypothetical protein